MWFIIIVIVWLLIAVKAFMRSKKQNDYSNPVLIYIIYWCMIIGMAKLELFDMISSSDKIYQIVIIGVSSFLVACIAGMKLQFKQTFRQKVDRFSFNIRVIKFFVLILLLIQMPFLFKSMAVIISGSNLSWVKSLYYDGEIYSSGIQMGLFVHVMQPLCLIICTIAISNYFSKKRDKNLMLLSTLFMLVMVFSTARRIYLGYFIVMVFFMMIKNGYFKMSRFINREKFKFLFVFLAIIIVLLILMGLGSSSLLKRLYFYFCGCIPCFSEKIGQLPTTYTYGGASFFSVLTMLDNFITIPFYESFITKVTMPQVPIIITKSGDELFNAFVTCFFYNYMDFGIFGVVVLSALNGLIVGILYKRSKQKNERLMCIYMIFFAQLVFSSVSYCFTANLILDSIIWMIVLFYSPIKKILLVSERKDCL